MCADLNNCIFHLVGWMEMFWRLFLQEKPNRKEKCLIKRDHRFNWMWSLCGWGCEQNVSVIFFAFFHLLFNSLTYRIVLAILIRSIYSAVPLSICQYVKCLMIVFIFCCGFPLHLISYKFRFLLKDVCNALSHMWLIFFSVWVLTVDTQTKTYVIWNFYICVNSSYIFNIYKSKGFPFVHLS